MGVLYWRAPTADQMMKWGMKETDFPVPKIGVWEENWDALQLFIMYSSQWRSGMNGPESFDFNIIHHALDRKGVEGEAYDDFIDDMRTIERTALFHIHNPD